MPHDADFAEFASRLRDLFFTLRGISESLLADLGCTAVERDILHDLDTGGAQPVPALALLRAVSRQSMQKTIDRLIEEGLVTSAPNPRHLRSPLLALTPAGRRRWKEIRTRERRLLAKSKLPVSSAELRRTTSVLRELGGYLSSLPRARKRSEVAASD